MLRRLLIPAAALIIGAMAAPSAPAFDGNSGFPFMYGFYQPYGIRYSTSVRTPPYFAVNPPVYYGARHTRPYGASPFASPPLVEAGENYRTRLGDASAVLPAAPCANPYCNPPAEGELLPPVESLEIDVADEPVVTMGPEQRNPFVPEQTSLRSRVAQK